jgi:hypothetical protein
MKALLLVPASLALLLLPACGGPEGPAAIGPRAVVESFPASRPPLAAEGVTPAEGGWRVEARGEGPVRLFERAGPACEECVLYFRARLKGESLAAPAYLEMWVRVPGKGEFFSKGFHDTLEGSTEWGVHEIPFVLRKGERPDLVRLNVAFSGSGGALLVKDAELLSAPLREPGP